ncbi:hypothetical protein SPLC1_S540530 [Arthrospira platensis C1]|nr:hypothetical protein SPLC1_S540530 [Arthrospira platensis C1]
MLPQELKINPSAIDNGLAIGFDEKQMSSRFSGEAKLDVETIASSDHQLFSFPDAGGMCSLRYRD